MLHQVKNQETGQTKLFSRSEDNCLERYNSKKPIPQPRDESCRGVNGYSVMWLRTKPDRSGEPIKMKSFIQ